MGLLRRIYDFSYNYAFEPREKEPPRIKWTRETFRILAFVAIVVYLVYLAKEFLEFNRTVIFDFEKVESIALPDVLFESYYKLNIACNISLNDGQLYEWKPTPINRPIHSSVLGEYLQAFHSGGRNFTKDGKYDVYAVHCSASAPESTEGKYAPEIRLFHPDTSILHSDFNRSVFDRARMADADIFLDSLVTTNRYMLDINQGYRITLEEKKHTTFIHEWSTKLFGFHKEQAFPYFTSKLESLSTNFNTNATILLIRTENYIMLEEKEIPETSILGVLTRVGGLFTAFFGIYALLFGSGSISLGGLVHLIDDNQVIKLKGDKQDDLFVKEILISHK